MRQGWVPYFLLAMLMALVAATSFHAFYSKWGFREEDPQFSLKSMFDDTASRPWAYRQLVPMIATETDRLIPQTLRPKLQESFLKIAPVLHFHNEHLVSEKLTDQPDYAIRFFIVYFLTYLAIFASMPLMLLLCRRCGFSQSSSIISSIALTVSIPILATVGGYYYDMTEILFMMSFILLIRSSRWNFLSIPLAVLATINKESFLFFIIACGPLILHFPNGVVAWLRDRATIVWGLAILASGLTHLAMIPYFAGNQGVEAQFWLYKNLAFYLNPLSLLRREITFGLPLFAGYSLVTVIALAAIFKTGIPYLDKRMRWHVLWAAIISAPLFLLLAYPGEMRNLSFLYPGLLLCLAGTCERYLSPTPDALT